MAIESNGVEFHRISTSPTGISTRSLIVFVTTAINSTDPAMDFTAKGFKVNQWIQYSTLTTGVDISIVEDLSTRPMYRAKEITATSIAIYGTQAALASTYQHIVGYGSELIGELTDFSGPSGGARIIDATPIDSTVQRIKTVMRNPGQISLSMNYEGFSYGQKEIRTDPESCRRRAYAIEFTDKGAGGVSTLLHSWVNFNGYCVNYSISAAVDSKISANAVIEIDGPMNWSSQ